MKTADAIEYFHSKSALAAELDITRGAIYFWGDIVPLDWAYVLQERTRGGLKINKSCYPQLTKRPVRPASSQPEGRA